MLNKTLHSIEDIKYHFQKTDSITYFVSATNFNLMAISDWVNHWFNINLIDCYDGNNKNVILPEYNKTPIFNDIESINTFLLGNKKIVEHINKSQESSDNVNATFLFYDKDLESLLKSLSVNLIMPPNELVKNIDNKIVTTEIGNSVDVPSVPNALKKVGSFGQLKKIIKQYGLGNDVVIQTAYGDSGKTTFFVNDEESYLAVADKIEAEDTVKVMKRINCLQVAVEACATRQGTFVGPILTEVIGHPDLTPYKGGWCGNDVNPGIFDEETQKTIVSYSASLGKALYKKGYRGYFEVDYLIDVADKNRMTVYLGELNPRVTGISALTNMSEFCNKTIPLYLFHLLEFSDTQFDLNPEDYNRQVLEFSHPDFGQLIFKYTENTMRVVTEIPNTGIYRLTKNGLSFVRYADNPRSLEGDEIFLLRILSAKEFAYKGADILILFANERLQDEKNHLMPAAESFISTIKSAVKYRNLTTDEEQLVYRYKKPSNIKSITAS